MLKLDREGGVEQAQMVTFRYILVTDIEEYNKRP